MDILILQYFISFSEFFVFILTVISSCFQGKETSQQPGGLRSPRENHAILTFVTTTRPNTIEQIYHLQFFFTAKPNPKNGTSSIEICILKWTSLPETQYFLQIMMRSQKKCQKPLLPKIHKSKRQFAIVKDL